MQDTVLMVVIILLNIPPLHAPETAAYPCGFDSDATQALSALVSCFGTAEKDGQVKQRLHTHFNLLSKRLVLGTIIGKQGDADRHEN